jgi:hypothetical protein
MECRSTRQQAPLRLSACHVRKLQDIPQARWILAKVVSAIVARALIPNVPTKDVECLVPDPTCLHIETWIATVHKCVFCAPRCPQGVAKHMHPVSALLHMFYAYLV